MNPIFESLTIKTITIPNRIGMPPMCQYSAENGLANYWHLTHYGSRATGGTGLIIVEATGVSPEARITPYDLGLWNDEQIPALKTLTNFIHSQGSVSALQLAHAGRKASHDAPVNGGKQLGLENGGWTTVGPSEIPFAENEIAPVALSSDGIQKVITDFANATRRALQAGFQIVEIHAAHGYLIHQFLSPLTNRRTDEYGGSLENRSRLLLQIVEAVQKEWPADLPLFVRISATDWASGGWDIDETIELCRTLKAKGVDLIDCSSGGNIANAKMDVKPLYQVKFAEQVKATGVLTSAVGLITSQEQIKEILENKRADLVLLGRELLRNPYFVMQLNDENQPPWPVQYLRAK